jgi:pimeloyl-ACP methyl ester carboxylesterase
MPGSLRLAGRDLATAPGLHRARAALAVLVPGMGDLRAWYRFLAPALKEAGYQVACTDLRGHGDSDATFSCARRSSSGATLAFKDYWTVAPSNAQRMPNSERCQANNHARLGIFHRRLDDHNDRRARLRHFAIKVSRTADTRVIISAYRTEKLVRITRVSCVIRPKGLDDLRSPV